MRVHYCPILRRSKWPRVRERFEARQPRGSRARLGAWPPVFTSWPRLSLALQRRPGQAHHVVMHNAWGDERVAGAPERSP
jgi:hypothetical protein